MGFMSHTIVSVPRQRYYDGRQATAGARIITRKSWILSTFNMHSWNILFIIF